MKIAGFVGDLPVSGNKWFLSQHPFEMAFSINFGHFSTHLDLTFSNQARVIQKHEHLSIYQLLGETHRDNAGLAKDDARSANGA